MKKIQVLGSGCRNCENTAQLIARVAEEIGAAVEIEKVTDMAEILRHGVMSTPGVVIDGKVVHAGGIPSPGAVRAWLS